MNLIDWTPLCRVTLCVDQVNLFDKVIFDFMPVVNVKIALDEHPWVTDSFRFLITIRQYYFKSGNKIMFNFYCNKVNRERKGLKRKVSKER